MKKTIQILQHLLCFVAAGIFLVTSSCDTSTLHIVITSPVGGISYSSDETIVFSANITTIIAGHVDNATRTVVWSSNLDGELKRDKVSGPCDTWCTHTSQFTFDGLAVGTHTITCASEDGVWHDEVTIKVVGPVSGGSCCFYQCRDESLTTNKGAGYVAPDLNTCMEYAEDQCAALGVFPAKYGIVNCPDCSSAACFAKWENMWQ